MAFEAWLLPDKLMEDKRPHNFDSIISYFQYAWEKSYNPRGMDSREEKDEWQWSSCEGQSNADYLQVHAATSRRSRTGVWPSLGQWKGLERVVFCEQAWLAFSLWKWREKASIEDSSKSTTTDRVQLCFITIVMEFDSGTLYIPTLWKKQYLLHTETFQHM